MKAVNNQLESSIHEVKAEIDHIYYMQHAHHPLTSASLSFVVIFSNDFYFAVVSSIFMISFILMLIRIFFAIDVLNKARSFQSHLSIYLAVCLHNLVHSAEHQMINITPMRVLLTIWQPD